MFRSMRRKNQELTLKETEEILHQGSSGVLSCLGDDGFPYGVPLNYAYDEGKIYFHAAREGHKIDAVLANPKVSFCVIGQDLIVSAEYTSYFRSAIVFGNARIVEGEEWTRAFELLVEKFCGEEPAEIKKQQIQSCGRSLILAVDAVHMTGKEAKELREGKE